MGVGLPGLTVSGDVSTSITFNRNWSVCPVLNAATCRSNSVFASFYLKDVTYT